MLASATVADPGVSAQRLTGLPVEVVDTDDSRRGEVSLALWEPPLTDLVGEQGAPVRRAATAETADLLADLVTDGVRTLAFVRSRRGAESVALTTQRLLAEVDPSLPATVAAYRGGYLPEDRRVLEQDLRSGRLTGVAATNALELGIDVSGLDAVLMAGFPGTRAAMWQQVGRAGRRGTDALAVLVARDDPLDTYVVSHPEVLVGAPVEATVFDPANPYVRGPHLCAAAAELPLRESDLAAVLRQRRRSRRASRRPGRPSTCWSSTAGCGPAPPAGSGPATDDPSDLADLRSTGGRPVELVERTHRPGHRHRRRRLRARLGPHRRRLPPPGRVLRRRRARPRGRGGHADRRRPRAGAPSPATSPTSASSRRSRSTSGCAGPTRRAARCRPGPCR